MSDLQKLTDLFRKLGANDPEDWATSQLNEGIDQLGRYLFLRQAWKRVIPENDHSWMDSEIAYSERNPDQPGSPVGKALTALLIAGCDRQEISDVVRGMQYDLLFQLCYLLDDPGDLENEVSHISWGLLQLDENGDVVAPILGLHESLLSMDPTGREMRPRRQD